MDGIDTGAAVATALLGLMGILMLVWRVFPKRSSAIWQWAKRAQTRRSAFCAVGFAVFLHIVYLDLQKGSSAREIVSEAFATGPVDEVIRNTESRDAAFRHWAAQGNLFMSFPGFDPKNSDHAFFAISTYYRTAYAIFPRRVFCVPDGAPVNNETELCLARFHPDEKWLDSHDVSTVVTYHASMNEATTETNSRPLVVEKRSAVLDAKRSPFWLSGTAGALLYVLLMILIGYSSLCLFMPREPCSATEAVALITCLGLGTLGTVLFIVSLAGLAPSRPVLSSVAVMAALGMFGLRKAGRLVHIMKPSRPLKIEWHSIVWVCLCAVLAGIVGFHALKISPIEWDTFAIWGIKSKVVAQDALRPLPEYFHDPSFNFSHRDYPVLFPLLNAGMYSAVGSTDHWAVRVLIPMFFVGAMFLIYSGLRRRLQRPQALFVTILLLSAPSCIRWSGSGNADLPLLAFYAGSVIYFLRWNETKRPRDLLLSGFLTGCAAFTKSEGVGLAGISFLALAVLVLRRPDRSAIKAAVIFILVAGAIPALWRIQTWGLPQTHETRLMKLFTRGDSIARVFDGFLHQFVNFSAWGELWLLIPLAAVFCDPRFRSSGLRLLWLFFIGHIALYVVVFSITSYKIEELLNIDLDRIFFHLIPVVALLVGYYWGSLDSLSDRVDAVDQSVEPEVAAVHNL